MQASLLHLVTCALVTLSPGKVSGGRPSLAPGVLAELPGLIAYWTFDQGKGTTAVDASKNALRGTLHGGTWIAGVHGKAVQFDKAKGYFDYGTDPLLNFKDGAPFTFAGWVKTRSSFGPIMSQRNSKDGGTVIDVTIEADGKLTAVVRADGKELSAGHARVMGAVINDGTWHHWALTRDGKTIELFLDGVSQGKSTGDDAGGPITTDLRALGAELYWAKKLGTPYLQGAFDEFCVFGRALNVAEIRNLAGPRSAVAEKGSLVLKLKKGAVVVDGQLAASDAKDKVRTSSFCKIYTIDLAAGKAYQIDLMSRTLDSFLRLENAAGGQLASDDDGGEGLNSRIIFRCPAAGSYRIIATTLGGGTGAFRLSVQEKR